MAVGTALAGLGLATINAEPAPDGNDTAAVVRGNNEFAFALYGKLRSQPGNLFFSPYSVSTALTMTYAGARTSTADEMAKTLHFTLPQERLHAAYQAVIAGLKPRRPGAYELHVANALWAQQDFKFLESYMNLVQSRYHAGLRNLDFARDTEPSRITINRWVEEQTKNRIQNLIPQGVLQPDTKLVLTNAIYFKANWPEHTFDDKATKPGDFHVSSTKKIRTPLMRTYRNLYYLGNDSVQVLNMPYEGSDLSFFAILPKKVDGLADVEKALSPAMFDGWLDKMERYEVDVTLPRFKVTAETRLDKTLKEMGMPLAFSDDADFSGMTGKTDLKIDAVLHKAFVELNEKGTEAAAATAVIVAPTAAPVRQEPKRAEFKADHPFVYVIRDNRSGSLLFVGRLEQP